MVSVDVERSFSQYRHILNDRRETKRLDMMYFNENTEGRFMIVILLILISLYNQVVCYMYVYSLLFYMMNVKRKKHQIILVNPNL